MDPDLVWIAKATKASNVRRGARIQTLWGGYGEIFRVHLTGAGIETAIVKWVKPPVRSRSSETDLSHARKCRSYEVEMAWYRTFAARCDQACRVPMLIDSHISHEQSQFLLEDLDAAGFPERHRHLGPAELDLCLAWLAAFHARFMGLVDHEARAPEGRAGVAPNGLWATGTYWHLATRPDELSEIEDDALREAAPILDRKLRGCVFQTIVHGDAKPANFCFAADARGVAAVDFQYAGGGCGMKDVAYFLSGESRSEAVEQRQLDAYFGHLRDALVRRAEPQLRDADVLDAVETEWRALYPIARADFHRFLAGWAKEHWKSDAHGQRLTRNVLRALA